MGHINLQKTGQLLTGDEALAIAPGIDSQITRLVVLVEVAPVGAPLVLRVQNVSGASPTEYIEATISAGAYVAAAVSGSVSISAGATFYVRVVSGPTGANAASYLYGYVETTADESGGTFCTVGAVKTILGLTTSTSDTELAAIIEGVTARMQAFMGRTILLGAVTDRLSLPYDDTMLTLSEYPVTAVASVTEDGAAVDPTEYVLLGARGQLYREGGWSKGQHHLVVAYTAGISTVPHDLQRACALQSALEFKQEMSAGNRLGELSKAHEAGGSTTYRDGAWLPEVLSTLLNRRRLA